MFLPHSHNLSHTIAINSGGVDKCMITNIKWALSYCFIGVWVVIIIYSNMTSFFRFVNKRAIYRLGIISLAHAPVHVTDFPVVNVHVDELSSARIWQHILCAILSAKVNINYRLPIKVYYRICTLRHIRVGIIHGSQKHILASMIYFLNRRSE